MPSTECGVRSAECGVEGRTSAPHSALRTPHLLAGAMMLALVPPPARAQQPDSTLKDTAALAPVVVTGVRLPAAPEMARGLTGQSATLSVADLDARGVSTLAHALEMLPGVTVADELGTPAQLDVTLRGFQVSPTIGLPQGITVYVDGVRVNEPDANEVNFDLLPLEDVERVEVSYGPSVLLGRNSLGAAVNLVTRRGTAPGAREVEVSGGSYGRYEAKLNAADRLGRWDYYVGVRYEHTDGWRQATTSRLATAFAKLGVLAAAQSRAHRRRRAPARRPHGRPGARAALVCRARRPVLAHRRRALRCVPRRTRLAHRFGARQRERLRRIRGRELGCGAGVRRHRRGAVRLCPSAVRRPARSHAERAQRVPPAEPPGRAVVDRRRGARGVRLLERRLPYPGAGGDRVQRSHRRVPAAVRVGSRSRPAPRGRDHL